ncbi:MAG: hypothetical protein M1482_10405 [Chloroflexi bacterium]|nr:hypothetical protein [Chloroflexota bacterium]
MPNTRSEERSRTRRNKEQFDEAKRVVIEQVFCGAAARDAVKTMIAIAQDPENAQCVRAARLLFEFTYGRPRQMVVDAGEEKFRAYLDQVRRAVLGDTTGEAGRPQATEPRRRGLRSAADPGTDPPRE